MTDTPRVLLTLENGNIIAALQLALWRIDRDCCCVMTGQ